MTLVMERACALTAESVSTDSLIIILAPAAFVPKLDLDPVYVKR
jgi:hypothetical protein